MDATDCEPGECRRSLASFVRAAWHVVEPGRELIWNWHLEAICEHLEAWADGTLTQWIITIPPGTSKSRIVGVYFIAWLWLRNPSAKVLVVGNSADNAKSTSIECRTLVESKWYRQTFGVEWELRDDQNTTTRFTTTMGGHRQAFGMGSKITGEKGDYLIVDDANDAEEVNSAAARRKVINKYDNAIWDRLIDLDTRRRLVVGQRTHVEDLIGHLLEQGGYFELRIPEEFNPDRRYTSPIGWTDPRVERGELLRPKQFTPKMAQDYRRNKLLIYQAKHLQEPRSKEGVRFKATFFRNRWTWDADRTHILLTDDRGTYRFHAFNQVRARFGTADAATSIKTAADFTAICSWLLTDRWDLVWLGCRRVQVEIPDQPMILAEEYRKYVMQWCAVEAVFANVALYQLASRTNMVVNPVAPRIGGRMADKLARAVPAIILAEAGKVWLPDPITAEEDGFPIDAVTDELFAFTGDDKIDKHDDVIDNLSYAVNERSRFAPAEDNPLAPQPVPMPQPGGGYGVNTAYPPALPGGYPSGHWSGRPVR